MTKRLRISHVVVQPVLVWDDGEELEPAEQITPIQVPLSKLPALAKTLPNEVSALARSITESEAGPE